jgi:copper(I)-binding protein
MICRLALLFLLLATPALAHSYKLGAIEIGHPAAPPTTGGEASVTLALSNRGTAADRLVGGSSPAAARVVLRGTQGQALDDVPLAPGRPVALRPGRPHLVLEGLARPLRAGEEFPLTLRFAAAGEVTVGVVVEATPGR